MEDRKYLIWRVSLPQSTTDEPKEGLRKRHNKSTSDATRTGSKGEDDTSATSEASEASAVVNPMRWYGLQPPRPLHAAQGKFTSAVERAVELGELQAQIMGMCDNITLALGQHQYNSHKLVLFGDFDEVFPWLLRRLEENQAPFC